MFIELIDLLRCPVDHEESWLVAAFTKMEDRFVIEGKLGCPVCSASYPIREGVADFSHGHVKSTVAVTAKSGDETIRYAAMLGLTRPGALVVTHGDACEFAGQLAAMTECRVIAVNPSSPLDEHERVGVVHADNRIPLATGSVDGIVLGASADSWIESSARVLRQGGRLVTAPDTRFAGNFRELARDERNVVAESIGQLVSLSR